MADIADGDSVEFQGSGKKPYILKNTGGVYSCTCPAWQFQGAAIEKRSCKHLRKHRGDAEETARVGAAASAPVKRSSSGSGSSASSSAPPLLLAHRFENSDDPCGWWMSEKLDGVRAYWDGKNFISRLGNLYHAPDWFKKDLPSDTPLDGELFVGRGEFQQTVSIVRRQDKSDQWKNVLFLVFDAPAMTDVFEARLKAIVTLTQACKYANALEHVQCRDLPHLESELARIENQAGEGVMLRQPASLYVSGRSKTLLKVKTFYDAEARVCGHAPGRGKHKGRLGALEVELKDGTTFSVGTGLSDKQRDAPPAVGSVITFRYQELTKAGVPRFPSFIGERSDVTWATMSALPSTPQTRQQARGKTTKGAAKASAKAPAATSKAVKTSSTVVHTAGTGSDRQRYEYDDGATKKFWVIERFGHEITLTFGKIGSDGQTRVKTFKDDAEALRQCSALAGKKVAKGYVVV